MKRQQAFEGGNGKMLKGGLHCHTTRSDGVGDPAEVIRLHEKNGYDFLALTDHRYYNYENFAPETDVLIIPGMEFDGVFENGCGFRCYHTVCIGPAKEDGNGFDQDQQVESAKITGQEDFQHYLDDIHNKNNLTFYCHPQWSSTPARYFEKLKGNFAMEIRNSGAAENHMDTDAAYWDELLGQGIHIYGVATDDGHAMQHHGKGWVRVNAEKNISSVLQALQDGKFYSSCGPEIYDFYVDGNKAYIDCSEAAAIRLQSDMHPTVVKTEDGRMTHAEFDLNNWAGEYQYIRMTVIDKNGKLAWTNPIWLDE